MVKQEQSIATKWNFEKCAQEESTKVHKSLYIGSKRIASILNPLCITEKDNPVLTREKHYNMNNFFEQRIHRKTRSKTQRNKG